LRFKHNDYEIISLARGGNDEALKLLFEKYSALIYKKVYKFNLAYEKDDMYQEGLMVMFKSIKKFDETMNKSFTRYFELNLERRYISIVSKRVRRQEIMEENMDYIYQNNHAVNDCGEYYQIYLDEISKILTKTENLVYTLRELKNYSIAFIKDNYELDEKVIYNSLYRAKMKINKHFST